MRPLCAPSSFRSVCHLNHVRSLSDAAGCARRSRGWRSASTAPAGAPVASSAAPAARRLRASPRSWRRCTTRRWQPAPPTLAPRPVRSSLSLRRHDDGCLGRCCSLDAFGWLGVGVLSLTNRGTAELVLDEVNPADGWVSDEHLSSCPRLLCGGGPDPEQCVCQVSLSDLQLPIHVPPNPQVRPRPRLQATALGLRCSLVAMAVSQEPFNIHVRRTHSQPRTQISRTEANASPKLLLSSPWRRLFAGAVRAAAGCRRRRRRRGARGRRRRRGRAAGVRELAAAEVERPAPAHPQGSSLSCYACPTFCVGLS